jgi:hypothetical protein
MSVDELRISENRRYRLVFQLARVVSKTRRILLQNRGLKSQPFPNPNWLTGGSLTASGLGGPPVRCFRLQIHVKPQ